MKIIFSEYAKNEFIDAIEYYELAQIGLSKRLISDVKKALNRISDYPSAYPIAKGEVRKCILHKFPYNILYSIENDHIFIIAFAHQHRKPFYWVGT